MTARLLTLLIWAAVLATTVVWGLPMFIRATPVPAGAQVVGAGAPSGAGLARLLGTPPVKVAESAAPVVVDSRFKLLGVVAPRQGQASGLALISVDGKPARSVGVGREIEPGVKLLAVSHRQAELGPGGGLPGFTLALPPLADANRGRPGEVPQAVPMPGQPGVSLRLPPNLAGAAPGQMVMPTMVAPGQLAPQPLPAGESGQSEVSDNGRPSTR